ncbi:MAG: DUF4398 domain-containing protein [Pseudomonadales bacterium]
MNRPTSLPLINLSGSLARSLLAAVLVFAAAGCATLPPPTAQLAVAEASVKRADTSNTRASAPAELQIAVAKLASAQQAAAREDYLLSAQLAEQAEVDAQVAMLHAESVRSQRSAQESQDAADALREETRRRNL